MVMATEVRPGLVLVKGNPSKEETQRIINEYDSMKASSKSEGSMFSYPYRDQPPEYVHVLSGAAAPAVPIALMPETHSAGVTRMTTQGGDSRPPAYAPGHVAQYGSLYPNLH